MRSSTARLGAGRPSAGRHRRRPPSGPVTGGTVFLARLAAVALGGLAGLRALPRDGFRAQIAAEGMRDAVTTLAPVLVAVGVWRRRPGLLVTAVGLTVDAVLRRNWHRRDRADLVPQTPLRVVTANLLGGNRQVEALGRQLVDDRADVVVVQELTGAHVDALRAAGLLAAMPHRLLDPRPGYQGSAVFARWPISDATVLELAEARMAAATVLAPGGPVRVVSVHAVNPAGAGGRIALWRAQLEALAGYADRAVIPVVLAGDYNATGDHRALGVLRAAGMVDAHDAAGRGLGLTWPRRSFTGHGRWPALPLMRLDHVFVSAEFAVRAVRVRASAGSDHRRVIADLTRPGGGS